MILLVIVLLLVTAALSYYFGRWVILTSLYDELPERGSNAYWEQNAWLRTRNPKTVKKDNRRFYYENGFHDGLEETRRMLKARRWW